MDNFVIWLKQSWGYFAAVVAGLILIQKYVDLKKWFKQGFDAQFEAMTQDLRTDLNSMKDKLNVVAKSQESLETANKALLRKEMLDLYNHCIKRGSITTEELQSFESLYEQYEILKGQNGFMNHIHDDFHNLPIKALQSRKTPGKEISEK